MSEHAIGFESDAHPVLAIEDLTVSFDGFKAVDNLNLYVHRNELRVVIGPNGAGKTTVLDLICGKTRATSGSIKFNNQELTKMASTPSCAWGRAQVPDPVHLREPHRVREPGDVLPAWPQGVRRADLQASPDVVARVEAVAAEIFLEAQLHTRPTCSRTARSSGWRSACC
jgi:urea transport system ATP-binding protein